MYNNTEKIHYIPSYVIQLITIPLGNGCYSLYDITYFITGSNNIVKSYGA